MSSYELKQGEKPINEYLSRKISVLSPISAGAVVLIHCYHSGLPQKSFTYEIERFFSHALCRSAVPFFFACSGFLLYATLSDDKMKSLLLKLKKRVRTVCLPWFLWLCIYIAFFWMLFRFLSAWNNQTYLCDWQKSPEPFLFILKEYVWGDGIVPLWFLKRLMLFFICSPVFIFLIKRLKLIFPISIAVLVFFMDNPRLDPRTTYFNDDLLCFVLGLSCSVLHFDLRKTVSGRIGCIMLAVWIVLCVLPMPAFQFVYVRNLAGVIALWTFYDCIHPYMKRFEKPLLSCAAFSFLIYCAHMIPLSVFSIVLTPRIPHELLRYFGVWILSFASCIVIGMGMKRFMPRLYEILSGSR